MELMVFGLQIIKIKLNAKSIYAYVFMLSVYETDTQELILSLLFIHTSC